MKLVLTDYIHCLPNTITFCSYLVNQCPTQPPLHKLGTSTDRS